MKRIATLDGWRGVAILLVLVEHATRYGVEVPRTWSTLGTTGVDIFFVISGFIITTRLLLGQEGNAGRGLSDFYIRRAARILPPVVSYLLVLCLVSVLVDLVDFSRAEVWGALLFARNYQYAHHPGTGVYTSHFWSLAIEEHFYLIWPALLLWAGRRRAAWVAGCGAIVCAAWRWYDYTHGSTAAVFPHGSMSPFFRTDVRADGLLLGSLLAILFMDERVRSFIYRNSPKELPLVGAILLILLSGWKEGAPTLTAYCIIAMMLASTLMVEEGLVHRLLNTRVLLWIGEISYGLYVWQQLFLMRPQSGRSPLGWLGSLPFNLIAAFLAATLSYYFLEKPIIRLAKGFLARRHARHLAVQAPVMH